MPIEGVGTLLGLDPEDLDKSDCWKAFPCE